MGNVVENNINTKGEYIILRNTIINNNLNKKNMESEAIRIGKT